MKALALGSIVALGCLSLSNVQAQYKGPRDYFPKTFPPPDSRPPQPAPPSNKPAPPAPSAPAKRPPVVPQPVKFKDVPLNSQFYLVTDTNRVSAWTKISLTTAKNEKTGGRQAMLGETLVRR